MPPPPIPAADADVARPPKPDWSSRNRVGQIVLSCLAVGAILFAFEESAVKAAVWAGIACCFAIFARIAQAEAHYERK